MTNLTDKLAALSEAALMAMPPADAYEQLVDSLVNAYRTGQLTVRPDRDAAIERIARAIVMRLWGDDGNWKAGRVVATAAYDAMFDGRAEPTKGNTVFGRME